jgi:molybdopterin-containing oxidoreductase family molybdopterin binding subunit
MPERETQIEAFDALDFIVVSDIFMSETAQYADIVLPVCFIFEYSSISYMGSPYLNLVEQAVSPAFESKSDFEITTLLGRGMGLADKFDMSVEEYLEASLDNDAAKALGITWERLKKEKRIWAFPSDGQIFGQNGFSTPSGKFEFYFENSQPMYDNGEEWDSVYESLPYWEPPKEAWSENSLFAKYPLIFTSERDKFKTHTMFAHVPSLLEIELEPIVQVNPDDAQERDINHGDTIKVFNDRGYVVIKAVLNPGIRKGMLIMDHGWEGDQFIDGHYNNLSSRVSNRVIPNSNFFDCLCEIVKIR